MKTSRLATRPVLEQDNIKNLKIVKENWNRWNKNQEDRLYLKNPESYGQTEDAYIDIAKAETVGFKETDNFAIVENEEKIVAVIEDLDGNGEIIAQMKKGDNQ